LLVEPQRTNLVTYSNVFTNAAWIKVGVTITPNYAVSPDGNTNASRVQFTTSLSQLYQFVGVQTLTTSSFYVKGTAGQTIAIYNSTMGYELRTLTGQWQRIEVVSLGSNIDNYSAISNASGATATEVLVYGAQLEVGSYATSYIPTTSASVTRNADEVYKTGISSLIGQTEGTIYLEADIQKHNESEFYIAISNGSSLGEAIYLYQPSGGILQVLFRTGGVNQTISILNANWNIGYNKIAIAYNSTSGEVFMNGVSQGTVALSALPTCSQLTLGARPDIPGILVGSGGYKIATLWKTRLTNEQLELLTGTSFNTYAEMASYYNYTLQ
jgi:hypothetical protein